MSSPTLLWEEEAVPPHSTPFQRAGFPETLTFIEETCPQLCPCQLWPPFLWASASSSRKAGGCQLMVRSLVWPSCESGTVSHLDARQGCRKGPRPRLAMPAAKAAWT